MPTPVIDSILSSTKQSIGIDPSITEFDTDMILAINSTFSILKQLGVRNDDFSITGDTETWADYLEDKTNLELVKTYIAMKVSLMFDPPSSSAISETKKQLIAELEWRINVTVDPEAE